MDHQIKNIANAKNQEIKNNLVIVPILKDEMFKDVVKEDIIKGMREILKIDDDGIGMETLTYDTETDEILSLIPGATEGNPIVCEDFEDDEEVQVTKKMYRGECSSSTSGKGVAFELDDELDNYPPLFICEICTESMVVHDKFRIQGCEHFYCSMCVSQYVGSKIEENVTLILCPVSGCCGTLEPQHCRDILPKQVFDRWGDALCEGVISASQKFYCPFKDCSALLIDDGEGNVGDEVIRESECLNCFRLFCAQCKVPWHPDVDCADFQKLSLDERERDDILLANLAKTKNWMRCVKCKYYVERIDGCLFMHCRCGYNFCYGCGANLTDHYCSVCKR